MEEKQKSAVEWLAEQVNSAKWKFADVTDRNSIIEQAKEMEKEIAEKEFFKGLNFGINIPNDMTPSQYYNEIFKQQEQWQNKENQL